MSLTTAVIAAASAVAAKTKANVEAVKAAVVPAEAAAEPAIDQAAMIALIERRDALAREVAELATRSTRQLHKLSELEAAMYRHALPVERGEPGAEQLYADAKIEVDAAAAALNRVNAARKAAETELATVKAKIDRESRAAIIARITRQVRMRELAADQAQKAIADYAKAIRKLYNTGIQIEGMWPRETVKLPGGGLLSPADVIKEIQNELWRLQPVDPLSRGDLPPLPGARMNLVSGKRADLRPLAETFRAADGHVLCTIDEGNKS
jgi:hypothetical protein